MSNNLNFSKFLQVIEHEEKSRDLKVWDGFDDTWGVNTYYADYVTAGFNHKPKKLLEVGVRLGYSAMAIMYGAELAGVEDLEFVGLDTEEYIKESNAAATTLINVHFPKFKAKVLKVNTVTDELPKEITETTFDVVHADGNHSFEGALSDMRKLWPLVRKGGMLIVDDCTFWDVGSAINQFQTEIIDDLAETFVVSNERGQRYFRKKNSG